MDISNKVYSKVTESVEKQPNGGWNNLLSVKNIKMQQEKGASYIKRF